MCNKFGRTHENPCTNIHSRRYQHALPTTGIFTLPGFKNNPAPSIHTKHTSSVNANAAWWCYAYVVSYHQFVVAI